MSNDKELWEKVNKVETEVQHKNGKKEDALLDLFREAMMSSVDTGGALRTVELCKLFGWGAPRIIDFERGTKLGNRLQTDRKRYGDIIYGNDNFTSVASTRIVGLGINIWALFGRGLYCLCIGKIAKPVRFVYR